METEGTEARQARESEGHRIASIIPLSTPLPPFSLLTTSFPSQLMVTCVCVHVSFSRYVCVVGLGGGRGGGR